MNTGLAIAGLEYSQDGFSLSLDLNVPKGNLACLLGPSGCGKTTLLKLIAGFLPPAGGDISLNGNGLLRLPPHQRRLGIVFQDYALFPHLSVLENVLYGITKGKLGRLFPPSEEAVSRAKEFLAMVRLSGYEKRKPASLSGGEQQRVALARALAPEPELLLLDEPLSALDVSLRKTLRREIKTIQKNLGLTALYVTHDQEEAMGLGDTLFLMNQGRILQSGTPEEVYQNPADLFAASFLGSANLIPDDQGSVLFFRPEDCLIEPAKAGLPRPEFRYFSGKVIEREFQGAHWNLYVETQGTVVCLRPGGPDSAAAMDRSYLPDVNQEISFSVALSACRLFGPPRERQK